MSARLNVHPSKSLSTRLSPATHKLPKKVQQFFVSTSSLHSENNICVFKTWQKEICLFSVYFTQAMNLAGGAKTCDNFVYFPRASCLDTHPHEVRDAPPCFTSAQAHKFHKCKSSQVHKWKCQNIRLVRAREVVNALQMQSIRRWIYFLAKGSFWPKTAKCRRELCTSNESSLCYILDLHSNHGGLAIVIVTIIHHIYFQFHCHDHQP